MASNNKIKEKQKLNKARRWVKHIKLLHRLGDFVKV